MDFEIERSSDGRSARLRHAGENGAAWTASLSTFDVERLIDLLGGARRNMVEPVSMDLAADVTHPIAEVDPRWAGLQSNDGRYLVLYLRHSGLGWYGFALPHHEAVAISEWLKKGPSSVARSGSSAPSSGEGIAVEALDFRRAAEGAGRAVDARRSDGTLRAALKVNSKRRFASSREKVSSLPPDATSFFADGFLITSTGLGFYYYGEGQSRINPDPFQQMETDSDRAAGIVAGAIVEKRLERAMRHVMADDEVIARDLFRPSGALGPFRTKIDLALLLGLITAEAHKNLTIIKNIRNDFAHHLDYDSFEVSSIRDRCMNLTLVEKHVVAADGDVSRVEATLPANCNPGKPEFTMALPDRDQKLRDPRFRYLFTANLFAAFLGHAADSLEPEIPIV